MPFCYFVCMGTLPACMCTVDMKCPQKPEVGVGPGIGFTGDVSCQPCWCWKPNPGPLDKQPVFLNMELSL